MNIEETAVSILEIVGVYPTIKHFREAYESEGKFLAIFTGRAR